MFLWDNEFKKKGEGKKWSREKIERRELLETLRVRERRVKGKKDRELLETMKENSGKKKNKKQKTKQKKEERECKKKKKKKIKE